MVGSHGSLLGIVSEQSWRLGFVRWLQHRIPVGGTWFFRNNGNRRVMPHHYNYYDYDYDYYDYQYYNG